MFKKSVMLLPSFFKEVTAKTCTGSSDCTDNLISGQTLRWVYEKPELLLQ